MKKSVIIAMTLLLGTMGYLCAQDTIDTNYYRYDHHFFHPYGFSNCSEVYPNGQGFNEMTNNYDLFTFESDNNYHTIFPSAHLNRFYMMYMFGKESVERTIYGIGICLDSIADFTKGDTLTVAVCRLSGDRSHMVVMDSISIKGGEWGKRRWMEIPLMELAGEEYQEDYLNYGTIFDNCIGETLYRQVLEIYFDTPVEAGEVPYIFFRARQSNRHGSRFLFSFCSTYQLGALCYSTNEFTNVTGLARSTFFFPILTPLPEWEEASMEQVIPWPAGVTPPPDNPHNPDNPDNPDNPNNPDNPSGNEGIGIADAMSGVTISPNPSDGLTTVSCPMPIAELSVFDMSGRRILHKTPYSANASIDTSPLRKGIYIW